MTRIGSLFSGYGGLDLACEAFFGGTTAWHSDIDPAASRLLAHHWPGVPNLGDITAVDWSTVEPVDVLAGGFPCQDVSAAGRRAGIADGTRSGLWANMLDAIIHLRPRYVVIENVRGLLSARAHRPMEPETNGVGDDDSRPVLRALGAVLGDLADVGYDAQWCTVAAAEVGACHRRERVFVLASPAADAGGDGLERYTELDEWSTRGIGASLGDDVDRRGDVAAAESDGRHQGRTEPAEIVGRPDTAVGGASPAVTPPLLPTPSVADATGGHATRSGDRGNELLLPGVARAAASGALLPTPVAHPSGNTPENHLRKKPGRKVVTDLAILVEHDMMRNGGELLPTPGASDASGGGIDPATRRAGGHHVQIIDAVLADPTQWGQYAAAINRHSARSRPAPVPTEPNRNGNPRLSPAFVEWMMCLDDGWVTDPALGLTRSEQLKALGNGVVPPQAFAALHRLWQWVTL